LGFPALLKEGKMKRKNHKGSNARMVDENIAADEAQARELWIPDPLIDDEGWLGLIDPAFHDRPREAQTFAHRLYTLRETIERVGEDSAQRIIESLDEGIKLAYLYTDTHRAALQLFYLYLAGELVGDDPLELLGAAIDRTIKRPGARQIDMPKDLT
jgi:hypothetical protein